MRVASPYGDAPGEHESECVELMRKIRIMEGKRTTSHADEQRVISAQRSTIDKLRKSNKALQEDIHQDSKVGHNAGTLAMQLQQQERLDKLYGTSDSYQRKMEVERRHLQSVGKELEVLQARALDFRRVAKGPQSAEAAQKQASRQMQVLENRLQVAEQRFSETLSRNKELREDIDALSRQRQSADEVQQKLSCEMVALSSEIFSLGEVTRSANTARSAAQHACLAVALQGDVEQDLFEAESRELARCIEADARLLSTQARRLQRVLGSAEAAEHRRSIFSDETRADDGHIIVGEGTLGDGPGGVEGRMAPRSDGAVDAEAASRVGTAAAAACKLVSELAGIAGLSLEDLKVVVAHFEGLEAANFLLFNECNDMNVGVGALQKKVRATENEIRQLETDGAFSRQKEVIHSTLKKRDAGLRKADGFREKQVVLERRVALLKAGAVTVLKALGCIPITPPTPSPSPSLNPSSQILEESNHRSIPPTPATQGSSALPPLSSQQTQPGSRPDPGSQSDRGSKPESAGPAASPNLQYSTLLLHLGQLEARSRAVVAVYSTLMGKQSHVVADFRAATSRPPSAHSPSPPPTTTTTTTFGATFLTELAVGGSSSKPPASLLTKMPCVAASALPTQLHTPTSLRSSAPDASAVDAGASSSASGDSEISAIGHINLHVASRGQLGVMDIPVGSGAAGRGAKSPFFNTAERSGSDGGGERFSFAPILHSVSGSSAGDDDDDDNNGDDGEEDGVLVPLTRQQIMSAQGRSSLGFH